MSARPLAARRPLLFGAFVAAVLAVGAFAVQLHTRNGIPVPEWPLAVDLLLVVPLAYLVIVRPSPRQAVVGLTACLSLGIFFGAMVLPDESKSLWLVLEPLRWIVVVAFVAFQLWLMALVIKDLLSAQSSAPLEDTLHSALERRFGASTATSLMKVEARLWLYALCWRPARLQFTEGRPFFTWKQGQNASNQLGFLVVMAVEVPVLHLLLSLYSPTAALVVTALSLYGLLFLAAEYRATRHRPITLDGRDLHLRYGLLVDTVVPLDAIASVETVKDRPRRAPGRWRLAGMGKPNVLLRLEHGTKLHTAFGERAVCEIYLGLDDPRSFVEALGSRAAAG